MPIVSDVMSICPTHGTRVLSPHSDRFDGNGRNLVMGTSLITRHKIFLVGISISFKLVNLVILVPTTVAFAI